MRQALEPEVGLQVALVEDNPDDGLLLLGLLELATGARVQLRQAFTLAEAQAMLAAWKPDVVLLDLGLPDSTGLSSLDRLLRAHPDLPVVVLTGDARPELAMEAVRAGAQDFLVKGRDDASTLLRTLRYAIERKRNLEVARVSEDNFRALFDGAPVGMVLLTPDGSVRRMNRRLARDLGEDEEGGRRAHLQDLVAPQDYEAARLWLESVRRFGVSEAELRLLRSDGRLETGLCTATRLREAGPPEGSVVAVVENLTWRRQVEAGLQNAQKMEALGRLAGGLAHDFNNLLTAIMGYAEILNDRVEGPEELQMILAASRRAAELTQRLLTFARRQVSQPRALDMSAVVGDLAGVARGLLGERVQLEIAIPDDPPWICGDPSGLDQILMNLILNARDAMPDGGRVRLAISRETVTSPLVSPVMEPALLPGDYVRITVSDTGEGITEEIRRKIFEPFFTTKTPERGTGLGLATVYGIVQQARGTILVDSIPGQGSSFHVILPAITGDPTSQDDAEGAPPRIRHEAARILVVEDDAAVRQLLRRILESKGHQVVTAAEGAAAVALGREREFDLVICDVVMPGMTGPEAMERIMDHRPNLRVLFTSGYTPDPLLRERIRIGTVEFLPKPFSAEEVLEKVRQVLHGGGDGA